MELDRAEMLLRTRVDIAEHPNAVCEAIEAVLAELDRLRAENKTIAHEAAANAVSEMLDAVSCLLPDGGRNFVQECIRQYRECNTGECGWLDRLEREDVLQASLAAENITRHALETQLRALADAADAYLGAYKYGCDDDVNDARDALSDSVDSARTSLSKSEAQ